MTHQVEHEKNEDEDRVSLQAAVTSDGRKVKPMALENAVLEFFFHSNYDYFIVNIRAAVFSSDDATTLTS
jgi:hypothetical protein